MEIFKALFKKELRLNAGFSNGWLILSGVIAVWAVILAYSVKAGTVLLFLFIVLNGIYLVVYMLLSLSKDWNMTAHLWLHSPQSGAMLLAAKLGAGLATMLIYMALLSLAGLWASSVELDVLDEPWATLLLYGFVVVVKVWLAAIYAGVWAAGIWTISTTLRHSLGKARRWVTLGLFLVATLGIVLADSGVTRWRPVRLPLPSIQYDVPGITTFQHIYLGSILGYLLVVGGVFYLASFILDQRAEV